MTRTLDVLVVESRRGYARSAVEELEQSGHRVHRCRDEGAPAFPCRGVEDRSTCPLEGPIDVALVTRSHVQPTPSVLEDGVACALRAGIPVVEAGSRILDPFESWITSRVDGGRVGPACEEAADLGYAPVIADIRRRCAPILEALGRDVESLECRIELRWPRLQVHLDVPGAITSGQGEALAVRALDAVRSDRRSFGTVNVQVHGSERPTPHPQGG